MKKDIWNSHKGISMVHKLICKYVIDYPTETDKLRRFVYDNYYERGLLASCISTETLSNITGASKSLVKKNIKFLEAAGFIRVNRVQRMDLIDMDLDVDSNIDIYVVGGYFEPLDENGKYKGYVDFYYYGGVKNVIFKD
jgi:hypothetical protein